MKMSQLSKFKILNNLGVSLNKKGINPKYIIKKIYKDNNWLPELIMVG